MGRPRIHFTDLDKIEANRKAAKKYNKSMEGKLYHSKYYKTLYATTEGKMKLNARSKNYHETAAGQITARRANRKHRCKLYGLTVEEYNLLLLSQNGKCAVCGYGQEESLCIDHNHKTDKIRGLLCHRCNRVLGSVYDDPVILQKLIKYLENSNGTSTQTPISK